jgi:hypothetical protein
MLSFEDYGNGKPIAIVVGKPKNNILFLYQDQKDVPMKKEEVEDEYYNIIAKEFKGKKKMKTNEIEKNKKYLVENRDYEDEDFMDFYNITKKKIKKKLSTNIELGPGERFEILPQKLAECLMVCGPSGSGKSTYCANYYRHYCNMINNGLLEGDKGMIEGKPRLFVFSRVSEDDCIDKLKPLRIKLDEQLIHEPIEPKELRDSCVLFDDIDTIGSDTKKEGKMLREAVIDLRDKLLEARRHDNITMLCTSHQIFNYKSTRTMLLECDSITFFTKSSGIYHIKRLLKEQIGLTKDNINKILLLPSRWVTIYKKFPQYVIHEHGAFIIEFKP